MVSGLSIRPHPIVLTQREYVGSVKDRPTEGDTLNADAHIYPGISKTLAGAGLALDSKRPHTCLVDELTANGNPVEPFMKHRFVILFGERRFVIAGKPMFWDSFDPKFYEIPLEEVAP